MQRDDDSNVPPDDGPERTAILNLKDLKLPVAAAEKNRHLLVMIQGSQLGQVFSLSESVCRIGRHEDSEVVLADAGISRRHARVVPAGPDFAIEDLNSANGTFVQGERIERRVLRDGDLVQFGSNVVARYSITDADHEAMLRHLYQASITDPLTRAYNREHFDARLRAELSYARRHRSDLALLMMDVDHFKNVNDTYGHQAGDAVLLEISGRIPRALRGEDVFARFGGEEFALILRDVDITGARVVGERLRLLVQNINTQQAGQLINVTVSVGCAALNELEDADAAALIAAADRRLYAAKRGGRNRVVNTD